ncbi:MAG TPA: SusC/RagA family TonB-linked outer membrane protein, partial [Ferruginibacter sp.]|nr:SusC/RagA family TonB-linked outer membrane protein [Ferruginibacter sp.]
MKKGLYNLLLKHKVTCLFLFMQLFAIGALAQVRIAGKVTDNNGNPLYGITVGVRGTVYATATNRMGEYLLNANLKPGTHTLEFSGIGFKTTQSSIQVSGSSATSDVSLLPDQLSMDEVIVTGTSAGTTRRQIGSYISTINADDLTKGATGNVLAALQGKTAGAQITQNSGDPAGGISVRLRGISSANSSSEPLYIVDGIIVNNATNRVTNTQNSYDGNTFVGVIGQNRLVDINPADIERIEVLNGAAAAAIYGSRANSGVVQIFTRRGKDGAPVINFTSSFTISQLRKKLDLNQAPTKFGGSVDVFTQDIITTPLLTTTTPVTRYDYQDYIFRTALGTDNNISVAGGTDKTRYYLSGSYFFNQGIVKNTDFQRYSFRSNLEQTLSKWLTFKLGLNYVNSSANEKPDGNSFFSPMNSVTIIGNFHDIWARDANGNLKAVGERGRANPVSVIEDFQQKQTTSRILANAGIKAKLTGNLTLDYSLGIDNYSQVGTTLMPPYTYNVGDGFFGGGATLDAARNGYASTASNSFFAINHDINATYIANITGNISSTTQLGFSQQYEKNNFVLFQGRGLAPFVQTVSASATILPGVDDRSEISITGAFVQQNFKFFNQLFLTGAVRVDGSSVFGKDQRNQVYSKASASYVVSSAKFWGGLSSWWDLLKLRVAYGQSGNLTGIGAYERFNSYIPAAFAVKSALNGLIGLANTDVKPERQQEIEFGADMAFLKNRVTLTVNVYNKEVSDLLIRRVVAPTTGYSSFLDNVGSLENKGFEIVLGGTPVRTNDITWNINAIYNHNRNKAKNTGALRLFSTNAGAPVALINN